MTEYQWAYERPDPEVLFGPERAERLFGPKEHCRFCERIHRPGWFFADCLNLQWNRAISLLHRPADE